MQPAASEAVAGSQLNKLKRCESGIGCIIRNISCVGPLLGAFGSCTASKRRPSDVGEEAIDPATRLQHGHQREQKP